MSGWDVVGILEIFPEETKLLSHGLSNDIWLDDILLRDDDGADVCGTEAAARSGGNGAAKSGPRDVRYEFENYLAFIEPACGSADFGHIIMVDADLKEVGGFADGEGGGIRAGSHSWHGEIYTEGWG